MTRNTPSHLFAVAVLALAATACTPVVATRGNMTDPDRVAEIKAGASTRDDVASLLGTPTSVGTFDPNVWYYIGQTTEKVAFFDPDVLERRIVVVHFDDGGFVREVKSMDKTAGQEIDVVDRSTPTAGRQMTFLEQMLGNIGRFSGTKKSQGPGR